VRLAVAALALLLAQAAWSQGLRYRLEVEAPREFAGTLRKGLNLARWQNDPQMNPEQLRRLIKDAEREARETAATEGYFSAEVETSVDESAAGVARECRPTGPPAARCRAAARQPVDRVSVCQS